jgi:hypothetical protein
MALIGRTDLLKKENAIFRRFFREWKEFERANEARRGARFPGDAVQYAIEKEAEMDATASEIEAFLAENPDEN